MIDIGSMVTFPSQAEVVLNTVVLFLMNAHRVSPVARQLRRFASHSEEALLWLLQDF